MHPLTSRLFPSAERLDLFAPLAGAVLWWLLQILMIGLAIGTQHLLATGASPLLPSEGRSRSTLFTGVALAPLLETALLLWLVSLLREFTSRREFIVVIVGLMAALAHMGVGYAIPQVLLVGLGFGYMTAYAMHRSRWVAGNVVFLEVWMLHAAHNLLALLPKEWIAA